MSYTARLTPCEVPGLFWRWLVEVEVAVKNFVPGPPWMPPVSSSVMLPTLS